jgi:UDP-2,3-diacylglucosamine hydrolase
MQNDKKIYFISDVHLGLYPPERSAEREKILVNWLDSIKDETSQLYLMGDIFDFWHEWKRVIPRGFTRFLGKIAEMADMGIEIHMFTGNHDIWIYDYLPSEIGLKLYRKPIVRELNGLKFFLAHGDGLGPGDYSYKFLKKVFTNKMLQWLFKRLHPNLAMAFGLGWSKNSRYAKGIIAEEYRGDDKEWQTLFAKDQLKKDHYDFFVFGHRHIPSDVTIEKSRVINLGDWINNFTYGVLEGDSFTLKSIYPENQKKILVK